MENQLKMVYPKKESFSGHFRNNCKETILMLCDSKEVLPLSLLHMFRMKFTSKALVQVDKVFRIDQEKCQNVYFLFKNG